MPRRVITIFAAFFYQIGGVLYHRMMTDRGISDIGATSRYQTPAARTADLVIHVVGLVLAVVGGAILLVLSAGNELGRFAAIAIYAIGMVMMLAFSLAYNFSGERRRPLLRRLDHAGIFVMIAGSYTPFTTYVLSGAWAWGMTIAVWSIAGLGILGKIFLSRLPDPVWVALYLAMGWVVVIAGQPIVEGLNRPALILLAAGGLLYTIGVIFHVNDRRMPFGKPLWHGHVVAAAGLHWAAILIGTVLPMAQ